MKLHELTTGLVDRLGLVNRICVENSGKLSDITGLVTLTFGMARGPN